MITLQDWINDTMKERGFESYASPEHGAVQVEFKKPTPGGYEMVRIPRGVSRDKPPAPEVSEKKKKGSK